MIDLTARSHESRMLRGIGSVLLALVVLGCLASLVLGPEPVPIRLIAGGFALLVLLLVGAAWAVRNRKPRWLGIDHEGVRLVDRRGRVFTRVVWADLAGVGVMTNEFARWRQLFSASLRPFPAFSRKMVSVPIWLELVPSGPDALARHPELSVAAALGRPRPPDQPQRWLIMMADGHGQVLPVGEHVQRWRPELWRGHRSGSALFGDFFENGLRANE